MKHVLLLALLGIFLTGCPSYHPKDRVIHSNISSYICDTESCYVVVDCWTSDLSVVEAYECKPAAEDQIIESCLPDWLAYTYSQHNFAELRQWAEMLTIWSDTSWIVHIGFKCDSFGFLGFVWEGA